MTVPERPEQWMDSALCAEVATEVFFPEKGQVDRASIAKKLCASCDVAAQCLEYALRNEIEYGIFGGVTAVSRRRMRGAA